MLGELKNGIRRRVRGWQRAGQFPLLLPHHRTLEESEIKRGVGVSPAMAKALALCDGTRTLAAVAREAGVSRGELVRMQERGGLVVWRSAVPAAPPRVERATTVIVSPHPDDAALSCGGRMLGTPGVVVLNV